LEAAMMLGRRGYPVVLAEAGEDVGGRVALEARLPGLAAWIRVIDYRRSQLARLSNVEVGVGSRLDAAEAASYGFDHIAVATGARWRGDGVGRWHTRPLDLGPAVQVLTPDDLLRGTLPDGERVLVFDDDHYFMGGALCEVLRNAGREVTLVTPESLASAWTTNTMEQGRIQGRLLGLGVDVVVSRALVRAGNGSAVTACVFTEAEREHACDAVVLVTGRRPTTPCPRSAARWCSWLRRGLSPPESGTVPDSQPGDHVRGDQRDRALLELGIRVEDADRVEAGVQPPADLGDDLVRRAGQREVLQPLVRHALGHGLLAAPLDQGGQLVRDP